jgi:tRNA(Ile2) C34 agmatinyltransferase TiaS
MWLGPIRKLALPRGVGTQVACLRGMALVCLLALVADLIFDRNLRFTGGVIPATVGFGAAFIWQYHYLRLAGLLNVYLRRRCLACGYDLATLPEGHRCPECGRVIDSEAIRQDLLYLVRRHGGGGAK